MTKPVMRVYLAAPYAARDSVRQFVDDLRAIGIDCTSSWLDESHEINDGTTGAAGDLTDDQVSEHAETDLQDVALCDVLVLFTTAYLGIESCQRWPARRDRVCPRRREARHRRRPARERLPPHARAVEIVEGWYDARLALQQWQIRTLRSELLAARLEEVAQ